MTEENKEQKISKHEFYFEKSLYDAIRLADLETEDIFDGEVDAYSIKNQTETTYTVTISNSIHLDEQGTHLLYREYADTSYNLIYLSCKRKNNDKLYFLIYKNREVIFKVGQHPSVVDIQVAKIDPRYKFFLTDPELKNLKTAIGLYAHGVGIGSFVYLRRIFETLVFEAFKEHSNDIEMQEEDFRKQNMKNKIGVLKKYLPSQLIKMKSVYSILSKGIHELTEEECLQYFSVIKLSVELILNQKIDEKMKAIRDELAEKEIQKIHQDISQKQ